ISGMTRSIPNISSSGNMSPASMTRMSSPISSASMFFPISPTPPSGMIRSGGLAKERDLLRGLLFGLLGLHRRRGREVQRERREVGNQRVAQRGLVQRRGGVIDGEDHKAVGAAPGTAVDARDRFAGKELPHRMASERHDDAGAQHLEMPAQPDVAGGDLVGKGVAVLGRPMSDDVGDEDLSTIEPDAGKQLVQKLPSRSDEGLPLQVLVVARGFAEEEDARLGRTVSRDCLPRAAVERAGGAGADLVGDELEVRVRGVLHRADYAVAGGVIGAFRAR